MTESAFPFGNQAEPEAGEAPAGGRNRRALLLGGAAGVVALAVAAYFLLFSGGASSGNNTAFVVPHHTPRHVAAAVKPAVAKTAAAKKPARSAKTFSDVVGRDPFKPLYVAPVSSTSGTSTTVTVPGSSASGTTVTGTTTTTTTTPTGTTTSKPVTKPVTVPTVPIWIELDSQQGMGFATLRVAYSNKSTWVFIKVPVPAAGHQTRFGGYFALLSAGNGVVTVQMGDGKPFQLKQGYLNKRALV